MYEIHTSEIPHTSIVLLTSTGTRVLHSGVPAGPTENLLKPCGALNFGVLKSHRDVMTNRKWPTITKTRRVSEIFHTPTELLFNWFTTHSCASQAVLTDCHSLIISPGEWNRSDHIPVSNQPAAWHNDRHAFRHDALVLKAVLGWMTRKWFAGQANWKL